MLCTPIVISLISYFSDKSTTLVYILLTSLAATVVATSIIILFRDKILTSLFGQPLNELGEVSDNVVNAIDLITTGKIEQGKKETKIAVNSIISFLGWINYRKFVVASCLGLVVAFSTLIGTSLLHKQNQIILEQNEFFKEQIQQQQKQIAAQEKVENQNIRNTTIEKIYNTDEKFSPRVKAEAVKTYVEVEKLLFKHTPNLLESKKRYVNLSGAELNNAWLESSQLNQTNFGFAQLSNVRFNASNLQDVIYRGAILNGATFEGATLDSVSFSYCELDSSVFTASIFKHKCVFMNCRMPYADFAGALTSTPYDNIQGEIIFDGCDLRHSTMDAIFDGNNVTIKNSNIYGMRRMDMGPMKINFESNNYESENETDHFYKERKKQFYEKLDYPWNENDG